MSEPFPLDVDSILRVLNYLNAGVYITDEQRRIVLWNHKAEEITGYRAEEVVGKACHDGILEHASKDGQPLCPSDLCPLYRSMKTGVASRRPVLVYTRTREGRRLAVSVNVAPLRDESETIIGGIEIFRDESSNVADLEFAKSIQQNLLPQPLPEVQGVDFDARYHPHDLVGGDFFDLRELESGRYGIMVADVSGHGVSAALYTMWLKSLEESHIDLAATPGAFLSVLDRELNRFVVSESFATMFYGVLDVNTFQITYSNAGHPPPLHLHPDDNAAVVKETEVHGPPLGLGILGDQGCGATTLSLEPGDLLLCYTDGITEVADTGGRMLGTDGLGTLLKEEFLATNEGVLDRLYERVLDRCATVSLSDDVLLLSVRRRAAQD